MSLSVSLLCFYYLSLSFCFCEGRGRLLWLGREDSCVFERAGLGLTGEAEGVSKDRMAFAVVRGSKSWA